MGLGYLRLTRLFNVIWHPYNAVALLIGALHALTFNNYLTAAWNGYAQVALFALFVALLLRATHTRQASTLGFLLGLSHFSVGISWIYQSLHNIIGLPIIAAVASCMALAAFLAIYYALAAGLSHQLLSPLKRTPKPLPLVVGGLGFASIWTITEWLREWLFSGFGWLSAGYAHVDTVLSAWAPIVGQLGITWWVCLWAYLLAIIISNLRSGSYQLSMRLFALLISTGLASVGLSRLSWVQDFGQPLYIRLTQGNIPQTIKWQPEHAWYSIDTYFNLAQRPSNRPLDAIILPETALPVVQTQLPIGEWERWTNLANTTGASILASLSHQDKTSDTTTFYNAMYQIQGDLSPEQLRQTGATHQYHKQHLVPFGEYTPPFFVWFTQQLNIPMSLYTAGENNQMPFKIGDQWLTMTICYEDAFGAELARRLRDAQEPPTILINVSNLGWFGDSSILPQHIVMSRMRTLETQRPMVRATNTGGTMAINAQGHIYAQLPALTTNHLDVEVQGTSGLTPFVRLGNTPLLLWIIATLIGAGILAHRAKKGD